MTSAVCMCVCVCISVCVCVCVIHLTSILVTFFLLKNLQDICVHVCVGLYVCIKFGYQLFDHYTCCKCLISNYNLSLYFIINLMIRNFAILIMSSSILYYYNRITQTGSFINTKNLFNSQFWGLESPQLRAAASEGPLATSKQKQIKSHYLRNREQERSQTSFLMTPTHNNEATFLLIILIHS